jgi:hypothetical protein
MSANRTVSIVLFVLGLILIGVGTGLSNVSETGMTTRGPWTDYPYLSEGAVVIIIGTVVLVVAYLMMLLKKTVSTAGEMPKTVLKRRFRETLP